MKKSYYIYPFLITLLTAGFIFLIVNLTNIDYSDITSNSRKWELKKKRIHNKLLAVPILLYHNIDGKGPYSVSLAKLNEHFRYFRRLKIKVVPLSDLLYRLNNSIEYKQKTMVITFDDGYRSMYTKLYPLAKKYNYPITLFVYTDFIREKAKNMLTWEQLRIMDKNGIDIECHTIKHLDLEEISNRKNFIARRKLYHEIYLAKKIIELKLNKKITAIAYPYGRYNLNVIRLSQIAGYNRVFSTKSGSNLITRNNYCLKRHHILNSYSIGMIKKIINAW